MCALGLVLGLTNPLATASLSGQLAARFGALTTRNNTETAEFRDLVERVRHEPRAVLADPPDVVALADRPVLLEPLIYSILLDQGRWDARPLVERICSGEVGLLVLTSPLDSDAARVYSGYPRWPSPILDALDQTMTLDRVQAGHYVYVPTRSCRSV